MRPVARIGDFVYFPCCGVHPIVTGDPLMIDMGRPVARIGDRVSCGGPIITGTWLWIDRFRPVSRIGDLAICCCITCCTGRIITGSPKLINS